MADGTDWGLAPSGAPKKKKGLLGRISGAAGSIIKHSPAGLGLRALSAVTPNAIERPATTAGARGASLLLTALDKPGQAIRTGLKHTAETSYAHPGDIIHSLRSFGAGAGQGLVGNEHTTASDLVSATLHGKAIEGYKLPFGVSTLTDAVLDPTSYVTLGQSAAAKKAATVAAETIGKDALLDAGRIGAKKALTDVEKSTLRDALEQAAQKSRDPAKTAAKQLRAFERNGRGGVKFAGHSIPGLTAESEIGRAAAKVNPKTVIGDVLGRSSAGRTVKGAVTRGVGMRSAEGVGQDAAREIIAADTLRETRLGAKQHIAHTAAGNVAEQAGLTPERIGEVLRATDVGGNGVVSDPTLQGAVDLVKNRRVANAEGLAQHGANEQLPLLTQDSQQAIPRHWTKEGQDALVDKQAEVAAALGTTERDLAHARPDLGIAEVNAKLQHLLPEGGKALEDNPIVATLRTSHAVDAQVEHAKFLDDVTKIKGPQGQPLLHDITEGAQHVPGAERFSFGGREYAGHPEVVKYVKAAQAAGESDESLQGVQRILHAIGDTNRARMTVGPSFHSRNAVGNIWMAWVAGLKNPAEYVRAGRIQRQVSAAFKALGPDADIEKALATTALSPAEQSMVKDALDQGVLGNGFFDTDLAQGAEHLSGEKAALHRRILPTGDNPVLKANRAVGASVENNARLALFMHKLDELGDARAAAEAVKDALFDYSDLTPLERKLKPYVPFYTFMRKNVPNILETAAKNPRKLTLPMHAYEDAKGHGASFLPDLPVNAAEDALRPITGTSAPGSFTDSRLQRMFQALAGPLEPVSKTVVETGAGASSYNGFTARNGAGIREQLLRGVSPEYTKLSGFGRNNPLQSILGFNPVKGGDTNPTPLFPTKKGKKAAADWGL